MALIPGEYFSECMLCSASLYMKQNEKYLSWKFPILDSWAV